MDESRNGPPEIRRAHLFLSGRVQGVGMRMTVAYLAPRHDLTGWVRNLPDGRVEIVAEGLERDVEDFTRKLRGTMPSHIRDFKRVWEPATGEWTSFRVTY